METAFAWIGKLFEWFGQFFVHWQIVDTREGALKWQTIRVRDLARMRWEPSAKLRCLGPGFHFWWPLFSTFEVYPVKRQTVPLATQIITTTDEVTVAVTGMIIFDVFALDKINGETYDPDDAIKDIAGSSLHDVCCHKSWEELRKGQGRTLDTALKNEAQKDLKEYGVRVIKFTLTTLCKTRVYRLIQTTSQEGEINVPRIQ